ncbi:MAG: exo-alpha-sialidase, partial [Flavobacteriaceae bacterium]|nr:exo-alpha-sialidase [Flavobacteriaceae bacterium]
MKNQMQRILGVVIILFLFINCVNQDKPDDTNNPNPNDPCQYSEPLKFGTVEPKRVDGGDFPAFPTSKDSLNEDTKPYYVPNGPIRGTLSPSNAEYKVQEIDENNPSQALSFEEYDEIGDAPNIITVLPEPSVAENGQTVMTTGNTWMSLSLDGGQTFSSVNPTTIFPNDYGGLCCDQVLQYVPEFDLFVWLLQYRASGGQNAIRIAV